MRWIFTATSLTLAIAAVVGLHGALDAVGKPFPGFLVLGNRVVASAGLPEWPATRDGELYQREIVAVDGVPLTGVTELHERVRALPAETPVRYALRGSDGVEERIVPTRTFGWRDFGLLYGAYLANGLLLAGAGLVLLRARHRQVTASAAPLFLVAATWGLTAMDLYGPYRLFRLHALAEAMLFPAALHMALCFPRPAAFVQRFPLPALAYAGAAVLALAYQHALQRPAPYVTFHLLAIGAFGTSLLALIVSLLGRACGSWAQGSRVPATALAVGSLLALGPAVVLSIAEPFNGGTSPQNVIAFTAFALPLSVVFAVVRRPARVARPRA